MKRFLPGLELCLAGCLAALTGCAQLSVSAEERAYALVASLNTVSRDLAVDNFLPDITDYPTLQDPTQYPDFWEAHFPCANAPYTVSALDAGDPQAVTFSIADSLGTWGPNDVVLVMEKLGNDWFIVEMQMDLSPGPVSTVIVQ